MDDYVIDGDLAFTNTRAALEFYREQYHKKKKWVGLTYEELSDAYNLNYDRYYKTMDYVDFLLVYEAVEAKLKEKNT